MKDLKKKFNLMKFQILITISYKIKFYRNIPRILLNKKNKKF